MIFPIRPFTTETRRIDDVNVRATPAVTGITAAAGFNQPGVVVTIGDGARNLARSGQQPQSGDTTREQRLGVRGEQSKSESVFSESESEGRIEAVFDDEQEAAVPMPERESARLDETQDSERVDENEEVAFSPVWGSDAQTEEVKASGVPYAALQRAASVQDLDVGDVAKALANTQIAVRVLATQEQPIANEVSDEVQGEEPWATDDVADANRSSNVPTDGVPYEALQRAVTEAENAQTIERVEADSELLEPVFLPPENGGAPWGRAVPFEEETKSVGAHRDERKLSERKERATEAQVQA